MNQLMFWLLALFISLSSPAMEQDAAFRQSPFAAEKPYSTSRPSYGKGQVEEVWENAKQDDGKVYDLHTGDEINWDRTKPRNGQWDMGHQGRAYQELYDDYMSGRITKEELLNEYRDPKSYAPQTVNGNRSRRFD